MKTPTFPSVRVVGQFFREREGIPAFLWSEEVPIGAEIEFEREPSNPHDPSAIKVLHNGTHMGYIERSQACFIAPHLDGGAAYTCRVTDKTTERQNVVPLVTFEPAHDETV